MNDMPTSDPFYVEVLKRALKSNALRTDDQIIVVCGGPKDEGSLREAGLANISVSNISSGSLADVEDLPYADNSFDAVIVHSGLHHCASPHRGLLEMYRVAKRCIILFEPADNIATRIGQKLGVGQKYEFAAVQANKLKCGGWRDTTIPNWVYRFTANEIRQTICCAHPFGPHRFDFVHRTRIPWSALGMRRNKLPLLLAASAFPLLRLLDSACPVFSNNMAAIVVKPKLPAEMFPWLDTDETGICANASWFGKTF